jgi:hypothetical protein
MSSINVNDQVSHPYKTTGKITVFDVLFIYLFIYSRLEEMMLHGMTASIPWLHSVLSFFMNRTLIR